ncbi:MAG TPA: phenylalanine--tRNA ligase subunit beta [bacterium]|nr:phenylalanine--tRNA ligase subunit beta [bacterium]
MLISYNWLKTFISLKEPAEKVVERLIHAGVEVSNVRHLGKDITKVIVAELLSVEKHPQADRLSLTKVSTGTETLQVVCGAKNIAPGQKVPLALVGAVLPGNFEIKQAKIRGVESFGMLCSAKELGLAEDAEGILILSPDAAVGTNFLDYMGLPDTLFELEITPNRADLLSHWGVAREVGALLNKPARFPKTAKLKESPTPITHFARVSIEAKDLCHLYTCRVIDDVKVGPSPKWLSQALEKLGQRSINNIVDVTNYVLHELGQPLHAFDLGHLHGSRIIVRKAAKGEKIPLLDNTERELNENMLVIADADRPVALAGIMGGSNSQVTEQTQSILLESAWFLPGSVRKTARQLGISTDSSYRFERGVDPKGVKEALNRAAALILEVAGGKLAKGLGEAVSSAFKPTKITFRPSRANALLGLDLPAKQQIQILKNLGCGVKGAANAKSLTAECPSYRIDLTREIDLIEELARLTGYNQIPVVAPSVHSGLSSIESGVPFDEDIRFAFRQAGLSEAVNSSFLPPNFFQKLRLEENHPLRSFLEVANPIAEDQKVLRPTLLPSLLSNAQQNLSHQQEVVSLFEVNKVFAPDPQGQPTEKYQAVALLAGFAPGSGWHSPERKTDFYDIKGLAQNLLAQCGFPDLKWEYGAVPLPYQSGQGFQVRAEAGELLVWGGAIHPKVLKEYDISSPCFALEVDLATLAKTTRPSGAFKPLPKFPSAWRDIALVVPDGVTSSQVTDAVWAEGRPELRDVRLFDLYRGPNLQSGHRSLAYRLHFQNEERTLTDQEVTQKVSKIVESLKTRYSIVLR